jgi:hypothetical protein
VAVRACLLAVEAAWVVAWPGGAAAPPLHDSRAVVVLQPPTGVYVHGNAAATLGNRAYFISGGTVPSSGCCATGRLFSLEQTAP